MTLRLPDSGAETTADGRRHAPSAARNAGPILEVLQSLLPPEGRMLELASGTGQHAAAFAAALPGWHWQPSDVNPENFASIAAWAAGSAGRIAAPVALDAGRAGWAAEWGGFDACLVVNLLHLIPAPTAEAVIDVVSIPPAGDSRVSRCHQRWGFGVPVVLVSGDRAVAEFLYLVPVENNKPHVTAPSGARLR